MSQAAELTKEKVNSRAEFKQSDNKATIKTSLTGVEVFFESDEIIVSKTDLKGKLTYINDVFMKISGFNEQELLGMPHNIIRHSEMPRCVFKLLWDYLKAGKEIFAYVNNRTKSGDHYWVLAHVTPSVNELGETTSYHSSRRRPKAETVKNIIAPLYQELLEIEQAASNRKVGLEQSSARLNKFISDQGVAYDELILSV